MVTAAPNPIDAPGTDEASWRSWAGLARLPVADIAAWPSVAVVAAHPDDEVLGAGGIIAMLASAGVRLRVISLTDGEASHPDGAGPAALADRRAAETAAALRALGARDAEIIRLRLPDTGLAGRQDEMTALLRGLVAGFAACLAPWEHDVHADHEAAGRCARRASRQTIFYPVWMWHWAQPGDQRVPWSRAARVPLSAAAAASKKAAIRCFGSQVEDRSPGLGPVLSEGTIAHFSRDQEVLFR